MVIEGSAICFRSKVLTWPFSFTSTSLIEKSLNSQLTANNLINLNNIRRDNS